MGNVVETRHAASPKTRRDSLRSEAEQEGASLQKLAQFMERIRIFARWLVERVAR